MRNNVKQGGETVYYESYGCASNKFDLEVMLGKLLKSGYKFTRRVESADYILLNTCGVKTPTESRMLERIRVLSKYKKPMIIAGCLPRINLKPILKLAPKRTVMLDPHTANRILEAIDLLKRDDGVNLLFSDKPSLKISEPKVRLNPVIEVVQIAEGCLGSCTYCCVRFARGRLFSYPAKTIIERIKNAVSEGVKEVWLTSQDSGAYGLDSGTCLPELLNQICRIKGDFYVRVGMMNPRHVRKILRRLIESYRDDKIFKFIHIPVQSGDNQVLKRMNRQYTVEEFIEIVESFRDEIPMITVVTDVIVGFPSESEEAFFNTINVIKEVKPDFVNVSRFFPRPGTPAKNMKPIPYSELKARSKVMSEVSLAISLERNKEWVGWEGRILVDEKGKKNTWIGRNFAYKPIVIDGCENMLGKYVDVRIVEAHQTYLKAVRI